MLKISFKLLKKVLLKIHQMKRI